MGSLGHRPALNGIRGIAILAVIASHGRLIPGGYLGVDVFFVLSGFLITTLLLEEWESDRTIRLRGFYRRRAARLLPALGLLLVTVLAAAAVAVTTGHASRSAFDWLLEQSLYAVFYVTNLVKAFGHEQLKLGYLWSLAQEEQFYMLWPLILLLALRRHVTPRRLMVALACAIVFFAGNRVGVYLLGGRWEWLISSPQTRSDPLLVGCLAALIRRHGVTMRRPGAVGAAAFLAVLAAIVVIGDSHTLFVYGLLPFAAASAVLILAVVAHPLAAVSRLCGSWPLEFTGRISYSLYLWHAIFVSGQAGAGVLFGVIVSFTIAYLSYRWVEQPCRRWLRGPHRASAPAPALAD